MADNQLSILGICAHRTDTIKGADGTLVKYTRDGHKVRSVVASRVGNQLESLRKAYAVLSVEVESLELHQRTLSGLSDRWEQMVRL